MGVNQERGESGKSAGLAESVEQFAIGPRHDRREGIEMRHFSRLWNVQGKIVAAVVVTTVTAATWLSSFSVAWAGEDDIRLVTKITGTVQVRGYIERQNQRVAMKRWQALNKGDILGPGAEVRTGKESRAWMQVGTETASHLPDDEHVEFDVLRPNTHVRLNDAHRNYFSHGRIPILQIIRGKVDEASERGKIPAAKFWNRPSQSK